MLLCEANDRQRRRVVQRREGGCCFELTQNGVIDQAMATKIWPTMHYAMPDRDRLGLSTVSEKPSDARDRVLMGSEICRFGSQLIVISVSRPELALTATDRLGLAREKHLRDERFDQVKSELERRRAAVQGKDC
jgi:hypothetical protein